MKNYFLIAACAVATFVIASTTHAFEEFGAHEHGQAILTLVQDQEELQLVLYLPAVDVVGFEHAPSTKQHHAKIDAAIKSLKDTSQLFTLSATADCSLEKTDVRSELIEPSHKKHHDEHHDEHHEDDHGNEGKNHHDHAIKSDTEEGHAHTEFEAEYHYECTNIATLSEIRVNVFQAFSSVEELEVQMITDSGQKLIELRPNNPSITL